jgi:DNA sulfur modification protein DndD
MRLLNLSIHNFGVFSGKHDFDLTPIRKKSGERFSLVVFSGQNGVGKSTLFQAMSLALHGPLALGDRVSRQTYNEFLLSRIHRYSGMLGTVELSDKTSLAISFQYVESGCVRRIQVHREWQRSGQQVQEKLSVLCDGKAPEVSEEDYQNYINELFPPGLAAICFFDAEKLESLSNPEYHNQILRDTLHRLLGLDYVERLQADLDRYLMLQGGGSKEADKLKKEITKLRTEVAELEAQFSALDAEHIELGSKQQALADEIAKQEKRLAAEGGTYAARRPVWQQRREVVTEQIEVISKQVRELCADLLPFTLVPELCQQLSQRLADEVEGKSGAEVGAAIKQAAKTLRKAIQSDELWEGVKIKADTRQQLVKRLLDKLTSIAPSKSSGKTSAVIHFLSETDRGKLQSWITQVLESIPKQVAFLATRLEEFRREQKQLDADLRRVPDEVSLAPIQMEINRLNEEREKIQKERDGLSERRGELKYRLDDKNRKLQAVSDELKKAISSERQVALAERSRKVLVTYYQQLIQERTSVLEKELVARFNLICRKEHLIASIKINPKDFTIELIGDDDRVVDLSSFSAGERQLYALSVVWALRKISGRQLPLVIDTPLARLDETHRSRLLTNYLPAVSDQVLLFMTDAEMDLKTMRQVEKYKARAYRLSYSEKDERTFVTNGKARQLQLVDPQTGAYNWEAIAELERMTNSPAILKAIQEKGRHLYDVWKADWNRLLYLAGYSSVITLTVEGVNEYPLSPSDFDQHTPGAKEISAYA